MSITAGYDQSPPGSLHGPGGIKESVLPTACPPYIGKDDGQWAHPRLGQGFLPRQSLSQVAQQISTVVKGCNEALLSVGVILLVILPFAIIG